MKKTLLILILVVALGVCAGSYWLGLRAEAALKDQLELVTAQYGPRFECKAKQRGVFTSSYRYAVTGDLAPDPATAASAPTTFTFELQAEVAHGPLPVAAAAWKPALAVVDVRLAPDQGIPAVFAKFLDEFPELRRTSLRAVFGFGGDCRASLAVPASKHALRDKDGSVIDVEWGGAKAEVTIAADATALSGFLDMPLLAVADKDASLTMHNLFLRSDTTRNGQSLYLGATTCGVAEIRIKAGDEKSFVLTNLAIEGTSRRREAVVDGALSLRGQIREGTSPQSLAVDTTVTVKNLDFAALDTVVGQWQRIGLEPLPLEVQADKWQAVLEQQAGALLSRDPTLTLDGPRLGLPSGNIALAVSLAYASAGPVPKNFDESLVRCTASARLTAARPALRDLLGLAGKFDPELAAPELSTQLEASLDDLLAQGLVIQDKDALAVTADFNGKRLTLNGKPLIDDTPRSPQP